MLVTIVLLFLVTELPQGALALCSGLTEHCFRSYYAPLGDTMDIVALINNGVNFALYCTMSAQFRLTFARLISPSPRPPVSGTPRHRRRHPAVVIDDPAAGIAEDEDGSAGRPLSDVCGGEATWRNTTPFPDSELPEQLEINVLNYH